MSMAQLLALVVCTFCLAALLLGLYRPTWVLPSRRATRLQVLLLYSGAAVLGPLLADELAQRTAHAQTPGPGAVSAEATSSASLTAGEGGSRRNPHLNEEEPEPESLRALANRMLLDLGLGAGHRLRIGRLTMVYEDPVTEAQALALGEFLSRSEVGSDRGASAGAASRHSQVQFQVRGLVGSGNPGSAAIPPAAYEVRIATQFTHRQELDPETKAAYQMVGLLASGIAFDGAPVHIHVCTALLRPLLVLRPQLSSAPPQAPTTEP